MSVACPGGSSLTAGSVKPREHLAHRICNILDK